MRTDLYACALAAARRGWYVFPVAPGGKRPAIPAAHGPDEAARATCRGECGRLGHGLHDATRDPEAIRAWWTHCPAANIGIATGPSGLVVLDLDMPKPGTQAPDGWAHVRDGASALELLCARAGEPMPVDTFTVRTRRGGLHLYFIAPSGRRIPNTAGPAGRGLGWCIDTRGDGGYVLGPGSRVDLPDGAGRYAVVNPLPLAPLPTWLADRLDPVPATRVDPALGGSADRAGYVAAVQRGETQRVKDARPGFRNDSLNRAAFRLGQFVGAGLLPADVAADALTTAAESAGLGAAEIAATVASGMRAGLAHPATPSSGRRCRRRRTGGRPARTAGRPRRRTGAHPYR